MRRLTFAALSLIAALMLPAVAGAQNLPKNIRIIVPYPAGGAGDVLARVLAQSVSEKTGSTIIVEDRPGAGSIVGTEFAARATPDGTTLLLVENPYVLSAVLHPSVHYHPVDSFEPLCFVADTPAVLAVGGKSDIKNLDDFLKAAKAKAGAVTYGSTGPASIVHIAGELLRRDAKVDLTYVPYAGSPPAMNAALSGHITAVIANYSDLRAQIDAGGLRAIAVPANKRTPLLPDVPSLAELGFKDIEASVWFGFVAPKGTPKNVTDELIKQFTAAMDLPDVKEKVKSQGLVTSLSCGAPFGAFLADQHKKYIQFVREFDIKGE